VEAKSPMAIVIPVRGSLPIKGLRVGDLSWQDFLGRVNHSKYVIFLSCLSCINWTSTVFLGKSYGFLFSIMLPNSKGITKL
jgi:hypothetical protein